MPATAEPVSWHAGAIDLSTLQPSLPGDFGPSAGSPIAIPRFWNSVPQAPSVMTVQNPEVTIAGSMDPRC